MAESDSPGSSPNIAKTASSKEVYRGLDLIESGQLFVADTSVILNPDFRELVSTHWVPHLVSKQSVLRVLDLTVRKIETCDNVSRLQALDFLKNLHAAGALKILSDGPIAEGEQAHNVPAQIRQMVLDLKASHPLTLLTQSSALARPMLLNHESEAIRDRKPFSAYGVARGRLWKHGTADALRRVELEEQNPRFTQRACRHCMVVLDTSSIMFTSPKDRNPQPVGDAFLRNVLRPLLVESRRKVVVPVRVRKELENHSKSSDEVTRTKAERGLALTADLKSQDLLVFSEDREEAIGFNDRFADPVFSSVANRYQGSAPLCFVTQDRALARSIIVLREEQSDFPFWVCRIDKDGKALVPWELVLEREARNSADERATGARISSASVTEPVPLESAPNPTPRPQSLRRPVTPIAGPMGTPN